MTQRNETYNTDEANLQLEVFEMMSLSPYNFYVVGRSNEHGSEYPM